MEKVKVLVLTGYGINCDVETGWAFEMAGADQVDRAHINRVVNGEVKLDDYRILAFPGGFSFGDHIASGKILALKVKKEMGDHLKKFVNDGRLVIGICNGFQTLVKMGILPGSEHNVFGPQTVTLTHNDSAVYEDRWVRIHANPDNPSPFLRGIGTFDVAIRHGEGKFLAKQHFLREIKDHNLIAFQYVDENDEITQKYPLNPNGSDLAIAGITNRKGNVLGMMPHPEVFINPTQHPDWTRMDEMPEPLGLKIFKNAIDFARNEL